MRKTFVGSTEMKVYSIISKLKIICFIRNLQEINEFNTDDNIPINCFISGKKNITKIYIMLNVKKEESHNHYIPLKSKNNNIELNKEKRDEIKKSLKIIKNKSKEIVKSI